MKKGGKGGEDKICFTLQPESWAFCDYEITSIIPTGSGATFCAGYDLHKVIATTPSSGALPRPAPPVSAPTPNADGPLGPMGRSRMRVSKPVIAAVAGHAVA